MRITSLLALLFLFLLEPLAAQDSGKGEITYLDYIGNPTDKDHAVYYEFRAPLKPGVWKYQKYFINRNIAKAFLIEMYYYDSDNKKQGKYKAFYDNGFIQKEGVYLNDLKAGEWRFYIKHKDSVDVLSSRSKLGEINFYKNDKKNGPFKTFYYDGSLKSEGTYLDDLKYTGICKWYYKNGKLASEENYDEKGNLIGVKNWDENGKEVEYNEKQTSFRPLQKDILKYVSTHFNRNLSKLNNFGTGKVRVALELSEQGDLKILSVQRIGNATEAYEKEIRRLILKYAEKDLKPVKFHNLPITAMFKVSFSVKGKF